MWHGPPCERCDGKGYHQDGCAEIRLTVDEAIDLLDQIQLLAGALSEALTESPTNPERATWIATTVRGCELRLASLKAGLL